MDFFIKSSDILIHAGIVHGFFLTFLLINSKNSQRKQNKILSALLILLSLGITYSIVMAEFQDMIMKSPLLIKEPFVLLIGPLLWFYVKELSGLNQSFNKKTLIHILPFMLFCYFFVPFHIHGEDTLVTGFVYKNTRLITSIILFLILIQFSVYFFKIINLTKLHRRRVEQEYSNIDNKTLSWIRYILTGFILVFVFLCITFALLVHNQNLKYFDRHISIIFSILIFALGYKGLLQKEIFLNEKTETLNINQKENNTTLSEKDEQIKNELFDLMLNKKPYLNPELTLVELAKDLNITRNALSQVINKTVGENFYHFINKYRIEEVKKNLVDKKKKSLTILAIALDAGFNSKSSFNSIFKKFTGLSPTEYRNRHL